MNTRKILGVFVLVVLSQVLFSQEIKILTWNIFMVPPIVFKSCQAERADLIADYIKMINPDIIVLEEAFMKSTRAVIKDKLNDAFPYQSDITKSGILKTNSGVWIFSKYPINKQDFIIYKKKKGSDIFAKKGATFVEIDVNNKRLQIIGTHTQSLIKYKSTRAIQFQQIKSKISDKYFAESIPQFIIGDLNCNYFDTTEYQSMLQCLDVHAVSFTGEEYSWNGMKNDLAHKFSEHTLETLDYILLRKSSDITAEIISTEILKPYSDSCYCSKKFNYLSDHNPVVATIKLK